MDGSEGGGRVSAMPSPLVSYVCLPSCVSGVASPSPDHLCFSFLLPEMRSYDLNECHFSLD